jgi:hypothetical protein
MASPRRRSVRWVWVMGVIGDGYIRKTRLPFVHFLAILYLPCHSFLRLEGPWVIKASHSPVEDPAQIFLDLRDR